MLPDVLLWDFDGVIMDSMPIRTDGFREIFKTYPPDQVESLVKYHSVNGGLSRYVKIKYFFEKIRNEYISEDDVLRLANNFSEIMLSLLQNEKLLITETVNFIKSTHGKIPMHVVSGSDGAELNIICKSLGLDKYFVSIEGSPTPKKLVIENIIQKYKYQPASMVLIGDSINDLEAAKANNINFWGYNNTGLKQQILLDEKHTYINSFNSLQLF